ncbi:diguanylate cyclase domain-containing protein [Marinicellulosiphila megalodicopiae]|uniref:diguanylate cyclase domain-containing protein n=1 Tax=Marinicellulosiphila megalodicopiae TaxID=2724896 RepID=UPI003BB11820
MRNWFNNLSLQRKVVTTAAILLTLSLAVTSIVFSFVDRHNSRLNFIEKYQAISDVLSKRSSAAIAFDDATQADQNLKSLKFDTNVLYACLYRFSEIEGFDALNKIVAKIEYPKYDYKCDIRNSPERIYFPQTQLLRSHQYIYQDDQIRGALILYVDVSELNQRFWSIIFSILGIGTIGAFVAYVATYRLLSMITSPILALKDVVNDVKENRDFSQRALKRYNDEVGELVDGFNQMLSQIETDQSLLEEMAYVDALTELPNRRMFKEQLARSFAHSQAYHSKVGVIFIDLDNFKWVNDSKGHDSGDLLLQRIATRLQDATGSNGVACRLGGDEFTVIVDSFIHPLPVETVAKNILEHVSGNVEFETFDYRISLSLGVAEGDYLTDNHISIMKKADVAVYHAKESGKGRYRVFDENTDSLDDEAKHA